MRERVSSLGVVLLLAIMALAASWLLQNNADMPQVDYAQARQLFVQEKVQRFTVEGNTLTLELRESVQGSKIVRHELYDFQLFQDDLMPLVITQSEKGIIEDYDFYQDHSVNWLATLAPTLVTVLLMVAFGMRAEIVKA